MQCVSRVAGAFLYLGGTNMEFDKYDSLPVTEEMGKIYKLIYSVDSGVNHIVNHLPYMLYNKDNLRFEIAKLKAKIKKFEETANDFTPPKTYTD